MSVRNLVLLAAVLVPGAVASAGPARSPYAIPATERTATIPGSIGATPVPGAVVDEPGLAEAAAVGLRHLPEVLGGWRLNGEIDRREWVLNLTQDEAIAASALQLAVTSAISVMPEASALKIEVNGHSFASQRLRATRAAGIQRIELSPGTLVAGANLIRVEARQRHRVDCSINSTYELWSEIDPVRSGLLMATTASTRRTLGDLAAIWPNDRGEVRMTAILPVDSGQETMQAAMTIVGQVALMTGTLHPVVDVAREPGSGPGLDIQFGSPAALAKVLNGRVLDTGDVALADPVVGGRQRLLVAGQTKADFDRALARLARTAETIASVGHELALDASRRIGGLSLASGDKVSLRDLGLDSSEFDGRMFRASSYIRLPSDFYPADTDKIRLTIDGGYAARLNPDSKFGVMVNGETVSTLPLPDPRGQVFSDRIITLPLGAFQPGLNRIDLNASVSSEADATCDMTQTEGQGNRFLLVAESTLSVPTLPRIAQFPNLAATAAGGLFPERRSLGMKMFIPHPDEDSLSAAATLAARFAVAAGRPLDLPAIFRAPAPDQSSALIVAASPDLSNAALEGFHIVPAELRSAWAVKPNQPAVAALSNDRTRNPLDRRIAALSVRERVNDDNLMTGSIDTPSVKPKAALAQPTGPSSRTLLENWRKTSTQDGMLDHVYASGLGAIRNLINWRPNDAQTFRPTPATSMILAQAPSPDKSSSWTLVTAPNARSLRYAVEDITAPERWSQIRGGTAAFQEVDNTVQAVGSEEAVYIATQPLSAANGRLIVAGWLSRNPLVYAAMLLLACLLVGAGSAFGLRQIGQKS